MAIDKPVLIRSEVATKASVGVILPYYGEPEIFNQGMDIKTSTLTVAGNIPGIDDCSGLKVYSPKFSGEVNSSTLFQEFSGTPYATTTFTCVG